MCRRSLATVCSSSGTLEACCLSTAWSTCSRSCQVAVSRRCKSLSLSSSSPPLWLAKVELVAGVTFTGLGPRDFLSSVGTAGAVEGFRGITKDPLRAACSKAVTLSFSVNLTDPSGTRGRGANGATSPGATNLLLGTTCAIQGRHSTSDAKREVLRWSIFRWLCMSSFRVFFTPHPSYGQRKSTTWEQWTLLQCSRRAASVPLSAHPWAVQEELPPSTTRRFFGDGSGSCSGC